MEKIYTSISSSAQYLNSYFMMHIRSVILENISNIHYTVHPTAAASWVKKK